MQYFSSHIDEKAGLKTHDSRVSVRDVTDHVRRGHSRAAERHGGDYVQYFPSHIDEKVGLKTHDSRPG